jgi:hypothetical protein
VSEDQPRSGSRWEPPPDQSDLPADAPPGAPDLDDDSDLVEGWDNDGDHDDEGGDVDEASST